MYVPRFYVLQNIYPKTLLLFLEGGESMAYRRGITARANLFYQHRLSPSISHTHRHHNICENSEITPVSRNPQARNYIQHRFLGAGNNFSNYRRSTSVFQDRGCGMVCGRNYSSEADKIEVLNEVVGVLGDKAVEVAPVANEVAIAAADSFGHVAALQYLIDYVHCFTGLSWWASIAVTTIIIRLLMLPFVINLSMKSNARYSLLKLQWEVISEEVKNKGMSPAEGQAKMEALFNEYCVARRLIILKGLLLPILVSFSLFFAVLNMAKKVPSFKEGGALWFTDLTTPDTLYVLPVLSALSYWLTLECNAHEGMKDNIDINVNRIIAALLVPFTASYPKAIFVYWITSSLFSLVHLLAIKNPQVKKLLGIPIIPVIPPSTNQKSKEGGKGR